MLKLKSVKVSVCRRFGLSMFWFVDASACRRYGLSTFRFVDISVCRRFGLSTFRSVDISVSRCFDCRRFGVTTFLLVTIYASKLITQTSFTFRSDHHYFSNIYHSFIHTRMPNCDLSCCITTRWPWWCRLFKASEILMLSDTRWNREYKLWKWSVVMMPKLS